MTPITLRGPSQSRKRRGKRGAHLGGYAEAKQAYVTARADWRQRQSPPPFPPMDEFVRTQPYPIGHASIVRHRALSGDEVVDNVPCLIGKHVLTREQYRAQWALYRRFDALRAEAVLLEALALLNAYRARWRALYGDSVHVPPASQDAAHRARQ